MDHVLSLQYDIDYHQTGLAAESDNVLIHQTLSHYLMEVSMPYDVRQLVEVIQIVCYP